jgi:hypothetical protein
MHIRRLTLIFVAGFIAASCSEKPAVDRNQNSQTEKAKAGPEVAAQNEMRTNGSEAQHPSASESESSEAEGKNELQPPEDEIAEDCVAFLRSTKTIPANGANADCPQCPANTEAREVLKFDDIRVDRVARAESTCEIHVTIRATFNPSTRENIGGGLTAWISPEQRAKYLQGEIPPGQQVYKVKIIYRRSGKRWRAVEFDRP